MPPPTWSQGNLQWHYNRHPGGQDAACWQDILQKNPVTLGDYEQASQTVYHQSWLVYSAQWRESGGYTAPRRYFVDDRLILAITDDQENWFITCYHDHYHLWNNSSGTPRPGKHLLSENRTKPISQRKDEYLRVMRKLEQLRRLINVTVIRM